MRILAAIRSVPEWEAQALDTIKEAFFKHGLIEAGDPIQRKDVVDEFIKDMSDADRHGFQGSVRYVAKHVIDETVGSLSVLPGGYIIIRLRNEHLRRLVPNGHTLLQDVLSAHGPQGARRLELYRCEVRERGQKDGFLFGEWSTGERSALKFLFSQRRAFFVSISLLFSVGLALEVVLTLGGFEGKLADLGLRLGAPMLVSSTVVIVERLAQWLNQRAPSLRWSPSPPREAPTPLGTLEPAFDRLT